MKYMKNERQTFNKIIVIQLLIQTIRSITASNYVKQLKMYLIFKLNSLI